MIIVPNPGTHRSPSESDQQRLNANTLCDANAIRGPGKRQKTHYSGGENILEIASINEVHIEVIVDTVSMIDCILLAGT